MSSPILVFNSLIMSGTKSATTSSSALDITSVKNLGVQVTMTGTIAGTVKLQGSNDGQNFGDIASQSVTLAGATTTLVLNPTGLAFVWVKALLTVTSGSGDVEIYITGKI